MSWEISFQGLMLHWWTCCLASRFLLIRIYARCMFWFRRLRSQSDNFISMGVNWGKWFTFKNLRFTVPTESCNKKTYGENLKAIQILKLKQVSQLNTELPPRDINHTFRIGNFLSRQGVLIFGHELSAPQFPKPATWVRQIKTTVKLRDDRHTFSKIISHMLHVWNIHQHVP